MDVNVDFLSLGIDATFDSSLLAKASVKNSKSHWRTLLRNKTKGRIELTKKNLTQNVVSILDKLRDMKNNPLKHDYKRQIGNTIKRIFPDISISLGQYEKAQKTDKNEIERLTPEQIDDLRSMKDKAAEIIHEVYEKNEIEDLGLYDACIAVLITTGSSCRIEEAIQLKFKHMEQIEKNEPIGIKSKGSHNVRIIAPNELLQDIFIVVKSQRHLVQTFIKNKTMNTARQIQRNKFNQQYILISSSSYMQKKLHELAMLIGKDYTNLGFRKFRKYITTLLTKNGAFKTAQKMNNHKHFDTTLKHYIGVIAPEAAEKTYKYLVGDEILDKFEKSDESRKDVLGNEDSTKLEEFDFNNESHKDLLGDKGLKKLEESDFNNKFEKNNLMANDIWDKLQESNSRKSNIISDTFTVKTN